MDEKEPCYEWICWTIDAPELRKLTTSRPEDLARAWKMGYDIGRIAERVEPEQQQESQ